MTKRIAIKPSARLEEMIENLMREKGYSSKAEVVRSAVIRLHESTFPPYTQKGKSKKQQQKIEEVSEGETICKLLEGAIIADKNTGEKSCRYYVYDRKDRFEREIPLKALKRDLVPSQYSPSREKVEQLQADNKTNY